MAADDRTQRKADHSLRLYCNEMNKLKVRRSMMRRYVEMSSSEKHPEKVMVSAEAICLQFRLILEHIAFASLVANQGAYAEARSGYAEDWNAKKILGAIAKVNPDFYPRPVLAQTNPEGGTHLTNVTSGFLTRSQFENAYDRCGSVLHARNPFRDPIDYRRLITDVSQWGDMAVNLLDLHTVHIVGQQSFVFVVMNPSDRSAAAYKLVPDGGDYVDTRGRR